MKEIPPARVLETNTCGLDCFSSFIFPSYFFFISTVIAPLVAAIWTDDQTHRRCMDETAGCTNIPDLDRLHTTGADREMVW